MKRILLLTIIGFVSNFAYAGYMIQMENSTHLAQLNEEEDILSETSKPRKKSIHKSSKQSYKNHPGSLETPEGKQHDYRADRERARPTKVERALREKQMHRLAHDRQ